MQEACVGAIVWGHGKISNWIKKTFLLTNFFYSLLYMKSYKRHLIHILLNWNVRIFLDVLKFYSNLKSTTYYQFFIRIWFWILIKEREKTNYYYSCVLFRFNFFHCIRPLNQLVTMNGNFCKKMFFLNFIIVDTNTDNKAD